MQLRRKVYSTELDCTFFYSNQFVYQELKTFVIDQGNPLPTSHALNKIHRAYILIMCHWSKKSVLFCVFLVVVYLVEEARALWLFGDLPQQPNNNGKVVLCGDHDPLANQGFP